LALSSLPSATRTGDSLFTTDLSARLTFNPSSERGVQLTGQILIRTSDEDALQPTFFFPMINLL
jgi:hypothetical protein